MNIGKGITWLLFVVVLNLVSSHRQGTSVDAVLAWAAAGQQSQSGQARGLLRTASVDFKVGALNPAGLCTDRTRSLGTGCVPGARVEGRMAANGQWHTT